MEFLSHIQHHETQIQPEITILTPNSVTQHCGMKYVLIDGLETDVTSVTNQKHARSMISEIGDFNVRGNKVGLVNVIINYI